MNNKDHEPAESKRANPCQPQGQWSGNNWTSPGRTIKVAKIIH